MEPHRLPDRELDSLERRLRLALGDAALAPSALPAADVYQTDDELIVTIEVPGFAPEELAVEVAERELRVRGEHAEASERDGELRRRLERSFERRFRLPETADAGHLTARLECGVLVVRAPRVTAAGPRRVPVLAAS